jgi:hypothetical protein
MDRDTHVGKRSCAMILRPAVAWWNRRAMALALDSNQPTPRKKPGYSSGVNPPPRVPAPVSIHPLQISRELENSNCVSDGRLDVPKGCLELVRTTSHHRTPTDSSIFGPKARRYHTIRSQSQIQWRDCHAGLVVQVLLNRPTPLVALVGPDTHQRV